MQTSRRTPWLFLAPNLAIFGVFTSGRPFAVIRQMRP